jgi:hypothetical protein
VTFANDTAGSDLNEAILMFWFPVVKLKNAARTQASASDITSCFHNEKETLFRLAFLITGDEAQAEASVINAYELTLQGKTPFRDWLFEWAKSATVRSAIRARLDDIRRCETAYKVWDCEESEYLSQQSNQQRMAEAIWHLDPGLIICQFDPFARSVLVLRGALHASAGDCAVQLNVSRESVVAAQCRMNTWLSTMCKN